MKKIGIAAGAVLVLLCSLLADGRAPGAAAATPPVGPLVPARSLAAGPPPPGSVDEGPAASSTPSQVEVVLAPSDPAGLRALLTALYDPSSPQYHHWMTPPRFDSRFGPSPATVAEASAWLRSRGLNPRHTSTYALTADAPAARISSALGTGAFHRYRTEGGQTGLVALGAPLLPASLQGRVLAVNGLSTLPAFTPSHRVARPSGPRPRATAQALSNCATSPNYWTMPQLSSFYGINRVVSAGLTGAGQTVAVYELAQFVPNDVQQYDTCFGLTYRVSRVSVDGGATVDQSGGTAEADLDIEQVATQAPGASIISYEAANQSTPAYDLWSKIVSDDTAKVISTSWGSCEQDAAVNTTNSPSELSGSYAYGPLFAQAAAQGQSILAASGDSGAEDCAMDYLYPPTPSYAGSLAVDYPASDPNVTAVGGTTYYSATDEPVWNACQGATGSTCAAQNNYGGAGGGGESIYETRPAWQPDAFDWPASTHAACSPCREVPDVSANAGHPMLDYDTYNNSSGWDWAEGTSYAAPLMAGLVADRNQGCTAPTGNFSPVMYGLASKPATYAAAFKDVTVGNNDLMNAYSGQFSATTGYDLASGLGTPIATGLTCPEVLSVTQNANPGDTVTITGLGLEDAQFLFGGTQATVVSQTATSAQVVVPAGSGYVTVKADDAYGAGTDTVQFAYYGAPTTTTTTTAPTTTTTTTTAPKPTCSSAVGRQLSGAAGIAAVRINGCNGYFVVDSAGQVSAFGAAVSHGDLGAYHLAAPIIAIEATPDGQGYWLLGSDGGVFAFGDAHFYGSTGGVKLVAPVVGMAVTPDNKGYWVIARDGGVFAFGDAHFYGSTGGVKLVAPVDGIAVAPNGHGYWLVASDGGVFTFTSDGFYGSLGGVSLFKPVVGMSSTPDGHGYTLVGSDGGVFSFGDAPFYGSLGGSPPATPVVDLSPAPGNNGYYLVTSGGTVYAFGPGARYFGSV